MPVSIRNPFRRNAPHLSHTATEPAAVARLSTSSGDGSDSGTAEELNRAFPMYTKSKSTGAIAIARDDDDTNSYKMSVVNDSGVYLPPSPPAEKKSFWSRRNDSNTAKNRPPVTPVEDAFTISKESFESYRRSFDISARSPINDGSFSARVSMDQSRTSMDARPTRASFDVRPSRLSFDSWQRSSDQRSPRFPPTVKDVPEPQETEFEEVKLNDEQPRPKRSLFHRFGGDHASTGAGNRTSLLGKPLLFGRKPEPMTAGPTEAELTRLERSSLEADIRE